MITNLIIMVGVHGLVNFFIQWSILYNIQPVIKIFPKTAIVFSKVTGRDNWKDGVNQKGVALLERKWFYMSFSFLFWYIYVTMVVIFIL